MMTGVTAGVASAPTKFICQESPYLSTSQPYLSLKGYAPSSMSTPPPAESRSNSASTSSFVRQATWKDIDGLKWNNGPALIAWNSSPSSSKTTESTDPEGVSCSVVMLLIFD